MMSQINEFEFNNPDEWINKIEEILNEEYKQLTTSGKRRIASIQSGYESKTDIIYNKSVDRYWIKINEV